MDSGNSTNFGQQPRGAGQVEPCTLAQLGAIASHPNNLTVSVRVLASKASDGYLDRLRRSWHIVASRNPLLRTRIRASSDGTYYQTVSDHPRSIKCETHDPKDVEDGAYVEVVAEGNDYEVFLHAHRAFADETSLSLTACEFLLCHNGYTQEVCRQSMGAYLDHQSSKDPTVAVQYWEGIFRTVGSQPQLHPFPLERQWPRTETTLTVPDHVFEAALVFAGKNGVRLDNLLYAVWAVVSTRHMAENQPTSIFVVTGRDRSFSGCDTVLGPADQNFPLVLSLPEENVDFLSWIRQVEQFAADASAHASIGYKRILETSSGAVHPQVKVSLDRTHDGQNVMTTDDDFSLVLNLSVSDELKLSARHNLSVPRANVRVLLRHVAATLEHAVERPEASISTLRIMSPTEEKLLQDYSKSAFRPSSGLVHSLVEQQAKLSPNANAVQYETDEPLTYSDLNRRSNQLARLIRPWGATFVPVHMRASANLIVALLAILKAGAAYVILDPDAPSARKSYIVEHVRAGFVLVDENTAGEFPNEHNINDLLSRSFDKDDSDLATGQSPDDIAYVIYTSGSTGKPKAALLDHRAAFNGLLSYPKVENLRRLLFFNPVFSAAQRCIWATLTRGGCLCLASKENLTVNAARTINLMQIDSVDMTSTTAALISPDKVPSLRHMSLGGELVSPAVVETWGSRVQLMSSYGLSEVTQLNWRHRLQSHVSSRVIGRPFDTTTAYILTPGSIELSPLLIPGELCLGGAQLARGYLNDPEETERRFIQNPFGSGRLYRTGDLAVRHADGSIELMGRIDFQVKINGQRVNPSEPNTIIQLHEQIEHSAVVPAQVGNRMTLAAVIVSRKAGDEWEALVDELRSSLAKKLALYMIPAFWVPVSELPLNANGKVDMRAISDMVEGLARSGQLIPSTPSAEIDEAALTDNERVIRKVWANVLSVPESGIFPEYSFVSLGGSSLEAIQAVSQLQSHHSLSLRVQDVILGRSLSDVANLAQHQSDGIKPEDYATPTDPFVLLPEPGAASLAQLGLDVSEIEDAFPVTPFQEAVVAGTMMGETIYIYSRAYSFESHSLDAVKDALVSLMASDRYLRTTFFPQGTSFLQVVRKSAEVPWETSNMDFEEYMQQQASKPMHAGDLWWRAAALPGNVLVITIHHALFDYWSNEFLPQDLLSLLQGTVRDKRPDFSRYVQYLLQHHDEAAAREFWEKYLLDARPTTLGNGQTSLDNTVSASLGHDIKQSASRLKVTPSVLLYGAWSIVLAMSGATDDVVMGVTLSGRDSPVPGILQMAGPTLAVAPLRIKVDAASSLEAHLEHVQSSLWDIARHSAYGLRNILRVTRQSKDLINTTVNFLIKIPMSTQSRGLRRLPEQSVAPPENIKLELSNDSPDQVTLSSTLEPVFAQTLVDSVAVVLKAAASAPSAKLGEFRLAPPRAQLSSERSHGEKSDSQLAESVHSESEKQTDTPAESWSSASTVELLHVDGGKKVEEPGNWFSASTKSPDHELGHSAFLRMAAAFPWKTAVEDSSGNRLTYAGLGIKVNRLASLLRSKGVALEQLVPLMLEKSINTVVAMLGVMVSGGAFLPLGPDNPGERNLGILEDSQAKIVITDRLNAEFFDGTEYEIIVMDDVSWEDIPIKPQVVPGLTPDSLVYVIYTSGSTGKPKGTLLPHRALATAVEGINESMNRPSTDRVLWSQNYSFDGSFFSFFATLASGCTLCVAPQNTILANLADLINKMRVNHVTMTPSMASLLHPDDVPTLEVLGTGGEPVSSYMLSVWAPRITVYSAYGPTEATICVTNRLVTPDLNPRNIGHPFRKVIALILDPDTMEPVSEGGVGELCLAGPHLAKGYLNRPEATEKVFHDLPNGRIYQTGDLARWLPNGEIELFGRKDDQVKINGYRVELGEVESVIMRKDMFGQCAVVAATVFKKKQLIAFHSDSVQTPGEEEGGGLLLPPAHALDMDQVKDQLTELPRYMVPTIWLPVSKLPVMVSAKVDRKRLQAIAEGLEDDVLREYLPQRETSEVTTEEELKLRSLWSILFDATEDDIHANTTFHELGGDSIAALNLISMLRRQGHQDIKVSEILSRSTLREQSELIASRSQLSGDSVSSGQADGGMMNYQVPDFVHDHLSQMGISEDNVEDIYPCSAGQVEFLTQGNKKEQFWQLMSVRAVPDDFDMDRWVSLTTTLTERNAILRTIYVYPDNVNKDPQKAVQVVLKNPALNLSHRSYETEDEKQRIVDAEWEALFDPAKPFVRYTMLVNSQDGSRHLMIKLDHASYDGTLLHIFDDQFKALHRGQSIPDQTSFKEFIAHVVSTPKQPQLDYWTRQLSNHSFDFPAKVTADPMVSRTEVARVNASVGVDGLATASGVTVPIVFQTAYSLLLAHLSGSRDVTYDNLIAGRNVPLDNPQLINGTLANFLPFHSRVAGGSDGDLSIERLLQDTQTAFWESAENGLVSLGEIYEALGRDRSTAAAKCLFCFQPFEAASAEDHQDHMRWIVMKMSKNTMYFNYALNLEVAKTQGRGEYIVRLGYDERAFTAEEAQAALKWYIDCLEGMGKKSLVEELEI